MKQSKISTRKERKYPQCERVLSTNFPEGFNKITGKCYVPKEDFDVLKNKYLKLFNRYKRELRKGE